MDVQFNINESVKVKLTDVGLRELQRQHDDLNNLIQQNGGKGFDEFPYKPDDEGYYKFQLHSLMHYLGHIISPAMPNALETDIILLNAKPLDKG